MTLRTLCLTALFLLAARSFWVEAASAAPDPATIYAWFKADAGTATNSAGTETNWSNKACAHRFHSLLRQPTPCEPHQPDQGLIEGNAYDTLRYRQRVCPQAQIFADVHVKHAVPLGNWTIEDASRDTVERGLADALIVSGAGTGLATDLADVERVRRTCPATKILLGSGVSLDNVRDFLPTADGFIVASSLKLNGRLSNPVDAKRVAALARALRT